MRITSLALVLGLAGCGGDKDADSGAACDSCDCLKHPDIDAQSPAADATDVYHRTRLYVIVDNDDDYASSIAFTDAAGADVPGTVTWDEGDGLVEFTPDAPLTPSTTYTATVSTNECEGSSFSFTTSDIGAAPVADLNSLVGRTWRMSLADGLPPQDREGLQAVIDMVEEDLLITATAVNGTDLEAVVGSTTVGTNAPQNDCVPTTAITLDLTENPYATADIAPGFAPLQGQAIPTFGGTVAGSFAADGSVLAGIDLTMVQDMEAAGVIMGDDLCELLPTVGVNCESCPSGSGECLTFNVWGIDGAEDTSHSAIEITQGDVDANVDCP